MRSSSTTPVVVLLAFHLALVSTTSAAGIRGSSPLATVGAQLMGSDCDSFADLKVSEVKVKPQECRSHGFTYLGVACADNSGPCMENANQKVLLSVSNVEDPSLVYFEGSMKPGFQFQISAPEEGTLNLPKEYSMTIFACVDEATSCDTILYSEIIRAPCWAPDDDLKSLSRAKSGIELVFAAHSPAMGQFQVEVQSKNGNSFILDSLVTTSSRAQGNIVDHDNGHEQVLLDGAHAHVSFPLANAHEEFLEGLTVKMVAELVDASSGHRCYSVAEAKYFMGSFPLPLLAPTVVSS